MPAIRRTATALATLVLLALAACGAPAPTTPAAPGGPASLRLVTSFDIASLDPVEDGFWMPEFGVAETPMRIKPTGGVEPWVIEALDQRDERTWVLRLRTGVTFQNGTALDATALAATMTRQLAKSSSAQAVLEGATVAVSGDREVTLTTAAPDATVPFTLADESVFPVYDVAAVEAAGEDATKLIGAGIYSGPYAVRSLDAQRMEMDPYAGHWGGPPPLAGVTIRFVTDPQARILAVQNGEADIAIYVPTDAKRVLEGVTSAFYVTPPRGTETLSMPINLRTAPFDDVAVRRAFSLGVDYRSLAQDVLGGAYDVAEGMYSSVYPFAAANQRTDAAAAAAALDGAGWRPGPDGVRAKDGVPLQVNLLTYPQQPDTQTVAIAMQAQLKPLGFDVQIRQVEDITAALQEPTGWNTALVFNGTTGFTGAPEPFLRRYLGTGGDKNDGGVSDPELDTLAAQLATTFDDATRTTLLRRIQQIVVEEKAYLVVAAIKRFPVVVAPAWRGYEPSNSLNHITATTAPSG